MDYKDISNYLSLGSDDAARMRGNRAIKRLVNKLGGFKPFNDVDFKEPTETDTSEDSSYQELGIESEQESQEK
jgi:hypothetical protein